jgi:hypothetical protein
VGDKEDWDGVWRDLSQALKATMRKTQQKAKQVTATATFRNIIASSLPLRIAAIVSSSVDIMNTNPPQAKKKLPNASVGGLDGEVACGGCNQTRKYVMNRKAEKPSRSPPQSTWIDTCQLSSEFVYQG